ncbi:MAG: hypothetical protein ACXWKC_14095 [Xanthobacteraceae bacterium]
MAQITEKEVAVAVLQILTTQPGGEASMDVLKMELPKRFPNSAMSWDEQLRNIKSHDTYPGNIFRDYYVITSPRGGWQITPNGEKFVKAQA